MNETREEVKVYLQEVKRPRFIVAAAKGLLQFTQRGLQNISQGVDDIIPISGQKVDDKEEYTGDLGLIPATRKKGRPRKLHAHK